jgi:hypothetical protein
MVGRKTGAARRFFFLSHYIQANFRVSELRTVDSIGITVHNQVFGENAWSPQN